MTAAEITPTYANLQGAVPVVGMFTKAAQSDWIVLPYPGVMGLVAALYTGAEETTFTYGTMTINNSGTAYTATDTSIVGSSASITRQTPYYILTTGGEIIKVITDATPTTSTATLSVVRGCLGTTASATGVAHSNTCYILNIIVFGKSSTGRVIFTFLPMPNEPKAAIFD